MDNPDLAARLDEDAYRGDPSYRFSADLLDAWLTRLKESLGRANVRPLVRDAIVGDMLDAITEGREEAERRRHAVEEWARELEARRGPGVWRQGTWA